jgi:phosphoribosylanthranilate isomerase
VGYGILQKVRTKGDEMTVTMNDAQKKVQEEIDGLSLDGLQLYIMEKAKEWENLRRIYETRTFQLSSAVKQIGMSSDAAVHNAVQTQSILRDVIWAEAFEEATGQRLEIEDMSGERQIREAVRKAMELTQKKLGGETE